MKTKRITSLFVWFVPVALLLTTYLFNRYMMFVEPSELLLEVTRVDVFALLPFFAWISGHNLSVRFPFKIFFILCQGVAMSLCYYLLFSFLPHAWQTGLVLLGWSLLWSVLGGIKIKPQGSIWSWIHENRAFWYPLLIVVVTSVSFFVCNSWCTDIGGIFAFFFLAFITYPFLCFIYGRTIRDRQGWFVWYHGGFTVVSLIFIAFIMTWGHFRIGWVLMGDVLLAGLLLSGWCMLWTFLGRRTPKSN